MCGNPFKAVTTAFKQLKTNVSKIKTPKIVKNIEDWGDKVGEDMIQSFENLDKKLGRNLGMGGSEYSRDDVPPPEPPEPTPPRSDEETANNRLRGRRKAIRRSRSVFTSPLGLGNTAGVINKYLTGQ